MTPVKTDPVSLTRAELREIDRLATEEIGIPSCVLMENAGRGAAEIVLASWREERFSIVERRGDRASVRSSASTRTSAAARASSSARPEDHRVAVFCGPGNNGGDGGVVARHLANAGARVELFYTERAESLKGDAALQRRIVERMGLRIHDVSEAAGLERSRDALQSAGLLVDGLLGTGFQGEIRPTIARAIAEILELRARGGAIVVALDLPSGLDADRGIPADPTVVADLTITFSAPKVGFDRPGARAVLGRVEVAPIGVPPELVDRVRGRRPSG
jgi:NAD(P)H-hydrate epimerase